MEWEKVYVNHIADKGLVTKIYTNKKRFITQQ